MNMKIMIWILTLTLLSTVAYAQDSIWNAEEQTGVSCLDAIGGGDVVRRTWIKNSSINATANTVSLFFKMNTVSARTVSNVSICRRDPATTWDCTVGTWTRLFFNGTDISPSTTSPIQTDNLTFAIDPAQDYFATYILEDDARCQYNPTTGVNGKGSVTIGDWEVQNWTSIAVDNDDIMSITFIFNVTIPPAENFTIRVTDGFDASALGNITANITLSNGSNFVLVNTTGNFISTTILANTSLLANISLSSTNYFNNTIFNHNVSSNLVTTLNQSIVRFNATDLFNNSVPGNFTINAITKANDTNFAIKEGLFNVTFSANGFFNQTQEINISALDNLTITVINVFDSILNVTAIEGLFGNTIQNFTVNVFNANVSLNSTQVAVGSFIEFGLIQGLNYTVTVSKTGFLTNITIVILNNTIQPFEAVLFALNDLSLNFFDEITLEPTLNVSFDIFSDVFSGSFNTTTGTFNLDDIPSTIYEIRYGLNSNTLAVRSYFLVIPIASTQDSNLTLLTIEENISFQFIRTVVDQNAFALEGDILEIQRPYTSDDNTSLIYRTVERALIDSVGDAVFTAIPNIQAYRFRVINNDTFLITRVFTPTFLVETSKELTVEDAPPVGQSFNDAFGISTILTFSNASSFYILDYNDVNAVSTRVCLTTTRTFLATVTREEQCSSLSSATLLVFVNQTLNGSVTAVATANISGSIFTLDTDIQTFNNLDTAAIFQGVALIIYILLLIFSGTMTGYTNMVYPIMFTIAATFAFSFSFLGMVAISAGLMGGVFVAGIVILVVAKK